MGGARGAGRDRSRPEEDDEPRIAEAMLLAVGEKGFAEASVQDSLDRSGVPRSRFYVHFANKEDCFARAYRVAAGKLCDEILAAAGRAEGWPARYRAGVAELLGFVSAEPLMARALLVEPHAAGPAVAATYEGAVKRLTAAVDTARHQVDTHSPPPLTARFVVATVEFTVREGLTGGKGDPCISLLPELVHFAVLYFFGEDAAQRAFEGA